MPPLNSNNSGQTLQPGSHLNTSAQTFDSLVTQSAGEAGAGEAGAGEAGAGEGEAGAGEAGAGEASPRPASLDQY